jgi:hypothetical protein
LIAPSGWSQEKDKAGTQVAGFDPHLNKPADTMVVLAQPARIKVVDG